MEKEAFEIIREICFLLLELKEAYQENSNFNQIPWMPSDHQIRLHFDALLGCYSLGDFRRRFGRLQSIIQLHISVNHIRKISNKEKKKINGLLERLEQEMTYLSEHYLERNRQLGRSGIRKSSFSKNE